MQSAVLGVPFPVNSVGRVPIELLDADSAWKARTALAKAQQLLAHASAKEGAAPARGVRCGALIGARAQRRCAGAS